MFSFFKKGFRVKWESLEYIAIEDDGSHEQANAWARCHCSPRAWTIRFVQIMPSSTHHVSPILSVRFEAFLFLFNLPCTKSGRPLTARFEQIGRSTRELHHVVREWTTGAPVSKCTHHARDVYLNQSSRESNKGKNFDKRTFWHLLWAFFS